MSDSETHQSQMTACRGLISDPRQLTFPQEGDAASPEASPAEVAPIADAMEGISGDLASAGADSEPETAAEAQLAAAVAVDGDSGSESEEEENTGQWSPRPLPAAVVAGQDVVAEDDDRRLLELLRAQVCCLSRVIGCRYVAPLV